ncbi:MAG: TMEM164 family-domain-containing protein [Linnemannia elongata]|nr:MAG: TMEM164 family-domain-containing protein [Linnemannia elongata]
MTITRTVLTYLEQEVVNPASKFVEKYAFEMPSVTDLTDTYKGTWYLSPRQHTIEFVCYNVLFFVLLRVGLQLFRKKGSAFYSPRLDQLTESINSNVLAGHVMDKAVLVLLCGSYALTVYHKVFGDSYMYLLQPCHVNLLLLIFTMVGPKESKVTRMAFNSYLHYIWATIFALSFPDTTENGLYLVIENFWFEHYLLLLVPIYLIYTGRFVVFPLSFSYAVFSYALFCLFHSFVLSGLGLLTGHNLNYMLVPPNSPLMHMLGKYYRLVIYSGIFISCLVSRYILVEVFSVGLKIKEWKKRNGLMRAQGIPDIQKKGLKLE